MDWTWGLVSVLCVIVSKLSGSSDAVYAYLLARYAVKPEALSGHSEPFRIGDIL